MPPIYIFNQYSYQYLHKYYTIKLIYKQVLKTRLQITKHLSPFQTTKTLFLNEGVSVLGLGLPAACARHVFYSGGRLMIYEWLRDSTPLGINALLIDAI